jgi:hypothetical protein
MGSRLRRGVLSVGGLTVAGGVVAAARGDGVLAAAIEGLVLVGLLGIGIRVLRRLHASVDDMFVGYSVFLAYLSGVHGYLQQVRECAVRIDEALTQQAKAFDEEMTAIYGLGRLASSGGDGEREVADWILPLPQPRSLRVPPNDAC